MLGQVANAGDSVWVEDPCGAYMRYVPRKAGLVPVPIPVDQDGLDVDQALRKAPGAKLAIVSPTHQYPTGATLSLARRQALAEWSEASGAWILESEIDGDYRFVPRPVAPIYALSRAQRVFYCGSLSKPLAPGLRANYLVVPRQLTGRLSLTTTLVPMLTQLVLARFNSAGHLALHMRRMRTLYARRRTILLEELRAQTAEYLTVPRVPEGGLRVAATLRHEIDDVRLARRCLAAGIKVDALSSCYASGGQSGLIIGFASTQERLIPAAVATLADVLRRARDS
jgi:GntR family transcriptional regulator/MocR family aminotransferase